MSFSIPIDADDVTITAFNITLTNVVCSDGSASHSSIFWDTPNANNDSATYCVSGPAPPAPPGECSAVARASYKLIIILVSLIIPLICLFYIRYKNDGLAEITLFDVILMFMSLMIAIAFYLVIAQQLGAICGTI